MVSVKTLHTRGEFSRCGASFFLFLFFSEKRACHSGFLLHFETVDKLSIFFSSNFCITWSNVYHHIEILFICKGK